jgi:hypothetical protein
MTVFPSNEWFDALIAAAHEDRDALNALGFADMRLGLRIFGTPEGDKTFGLRLESYDVASDGEVDLAEWGADCVFEGPAEVWDEMIANIVEHGGADLAHTLNALSLAEEPMRVVADDPMGRDLFFRYNQTLQEVFDRGRSIPTKFLEPA